MLPIKFLKRKLHSKKGMTLVETLCAVMVLAIVCVGVLNSVAFSREMVYTNNEREKASYKAQFVADEIISAATGMTPPDDAGTIVGKVEKIANSTGGDDIQNESIGSVENIGNGNDFHEPIGDDNFIQYKLIPVEEDTVSDTDIAVKVDGIDQVTTIHAVKQTGWDIIVRVYYKRVGGEDGYNFVEVNAFAAQTSVG